MTSPSRLEELKADVRYRRERRDLYRAKMHGSRPTSPGHLRELERAFALSESRLARNLADLQDRDVSRVDSN